MTERTEPTASFRIEPAAESNRKVGSADDLATERFQRAIDACHDGGGGTVTVSSGEYVLGTVQLRSDVTLRLEAGSRLLPAESKSAYVDRHVGPDGERPFVLAEGVENGAIVGDGTIDGRGTEIMDMDEPIRQHSGESDGHPLVSNAPHRARQGDAYLERSGTLDEWPVAKPSFRPGPMLHFVDCEGVSIRDVTLRDMPAWTLSFDDCADVDVRGVTIRNHMRIPNCDGIAIGNSRNVRIADCAIESCDDAITLVSHADRERDCERVTVTNCTLASSACAIKFGSETSGDIRHCTFDNCVVHGSNRGLGIQHRDGGTIENVLFSNITVATHLRPGPWWGKAEPIYVTSVPRDEDTDLGAVRNIRFTNIAADAENGALVYGHADSTLERIRLDSISLSIDGSRHAAAVGGNVDLQPTAVMAPIYEDAISGIHFERVTDVELCDVTLEWADDVPAYFAHGVRCVDVDELVIDGVTGRQAQLGSPESGDGDETNGDEADAAGPAAIVLEGTTRSTIRNCRAAPGTERFLSTSGSADDRLFATNDLTDATIPIEGDSEHSTVGNVPPL
ncbi:glycoside hydrolase family 28 protein [Natronorubrum halophilum]|uniref:glycoside hydrolase family 28 protein n=1 Tax=Natronorubrum halophilum TaxID=1702106 RepID=UPI000EF7416A|nr:glycosyl hydrolase family 28 protein [Natronorubrum halophilum]